MIYLKKSSNNEESPYVVSEIKLLNTISSHSFMVSSIF